MGLKKVSTLLAAQLGIKTDKITLQSRIVDDLGADSLDVVELLMTLEDEYKITVSDKEAMSLKTVEDILRIIEKHGKK